MSPRHFSQMSYVVLDEMFLESYAMCLLDLQIQHFLGVWKTSCKDAFKVSFSIALKTILLTCLKTVFVKSVLILYHYKRCLLDSYARYLLDLQIQHLLGVWKTSRRDILIVCMYVCMYVCGCVSLYVWNYENNRSSRLEVFCKKVFFEISQNS